LDFHGGNDLVYKEYEKYTFYEYKIAKKGMNNSSKKVKSA